MTGAIQRIWTEYLRPLFRRPARFQVAALCHRETDGRPEILLITSRDTGRWLLPKGWPITGQDAAGAAAIEAWEEAGVEALHVGNSALGSYSYNKRLEGGVPVPCETKVFPIEVSRLADDYPHREIRERRWVSPEEAATMVDEPGLRTILARFAPGPGAAPLR